MKKDNTEYQLRVEIREQLNLVTRVNSPNIWQAIYFPDGRLNPKGYAAIEEKVIYRIIEGQIVPAAAIPQLEEELNLM